jgi:acyl carrier protein
VKKQPTEEELILFCREELSQMMGVPPESIDIHVTFESLRLNSIHAMQMLDELEDSLNITLSPLVFWENPTLSAFCKHIATQLKS